MTADAQAAIQELRLKRVRKAIAELEAAVREGHETSQRLLEVSRLLERGIDYRLIPVTPADLERLLEVARRIEAGADAQSPSRPSRRGPRVQV